MRDGFDDCDDDDVDDGEGARDNTELLQGRTERAG